MLNGFLVYVGGVERPVPESGQRLLIFLGLRTYGAPRRVVAGQLWPETSDDRAAANLRATLWKVGRAVAPGVISSSTAYLQLSSEVAVDVRELLDLSDELAGLGPSRPRRSSVRRLLTGELLPDWDEDWLLPEREQLRLIQLAGLERWAEALIAVGLCDEAVRVAACAAEAEPLRETAQRALIQAHLASGNRSEAVRQYKRHASALAEELGMLPSLELAELIDSVGLRIPNADQDLQRRS